MKPIAFEARTEALELYLHELSADKTVEKTRIPKGAVVAIIKDAREGKYPARETSRAGLSYTA